GGRDDDRVEVLAVEQLAVVVEHFGTAAGLLRGEVEVGLVNVAQGDDLGVLVREERVEHLVAAIAEADEPEPDAVVGPKDVAGAQGGGRGRGAGGRGKVRAVDL